MWAMLETVWQVLWANLTVNNINASATTINALAAVILAIITFVHVRQNKTLVRIETERSAFEAQRADLASRPYLEVRLFKLGEDRNRPVFEALNVGVCPAVRVRFDNTRDLLWDDLSATYQGFSTIPAGQLARFSFYRPLHGGETPQGAWSTEFRIRYNDAAGLHEYADKWRLGVDVGVSYLVRVNATVLKTQPLESEDYVLNQGPQ
jgi:hypothetical protein